MQGLDSEVEVISDASLELIKKVFLVLFGEVHLRNF